MHPQRKHRIARFLTALVVFIATSAGLHAVARSQGWTLHHGWNHHDQFCAVTQPSLSSKDLT